MNIDRRQVMDYETDYSKRMILKLFVLTLWKLEVCEMEYYDAFYNSLLLGG
jgi:hypothetical protein